MAKQTVNVGNNANDGSGDAARTAFTKINQNFSDLYGRDDPNMNYRLIQYGGTGATTIEGAAANLATLGAGQTWRAVKANRAINTTYVNTTGRLIAVSIRFEAIKSGLSGIRLGLYTENKLQQQAYQLGALGVSLFCIVENGQTYALNLLSGALPADFSIEEWNELS